MSIFRPPAAPQVIRNGIAALLPAAAAIVPMGSSAASQALVAYRAPTQALQQPKPPASQWGIPDADLIFDRLWPISQQQGQPWPYAATALPAPKVVQPGAAAAAYVPPRRQHQQPPSQPWPHYLAQPDAPASQFGIPDLKLVFDKLANGSGGGATAWATQQAPQWPYMATMLPAAKVLPQVVAASPFVWPDPAVIAPPPGSWPYASLTEPQPSTFAFAQPTPPVRPTFTPQLLTQQPWPHRLTQPVALQPIPTPVIQPPPQYVQWTPLPAPWPYALQQRAPVLLATPLPGYSVTPTIVLITPPPPPLRVLQPKFPWPMPDANAGIPVPWRAPVVANWFRWPHAVDEQMRLNLAGTTAFLSDESPIPVPFDVASGPEAAINLRTREVLALVFDDDDALLGGNRLNGAFVKLRLVPGSNATRARDKRGDLYLIV